MHTPRSDSHVSTERMSTSSMPAWAMRSASSSSNRTPVWATTLPSASRASSCNTRPTMRSASGSITSSPSLRALICSPWLVMQSSWLITTSWATSTIRRVRYPASAVFRAVSAKPLRAPWVEMKYSSTDNPSLKEAIIGVSIISPTAPVSFFCGLFIRPRMPPSCLI